MATYGCLHANISEEAPGSLFCLQRWEKGKGEKKGLIADLPLQGRNLNIPSHSALALNMQWKRALREETNLVRMCNLFSTVEEEALLGAAQLKFREMSIYPEKEHWVGGVYVAEAHRGKGIARQILVELIAIAKSLKIETLYLQTEHLNGGLYGRMGWTPIEQVNYRGIDVLVMEKSIM